MVDLPSRPVGQPSPRAPLLLQAHLGGSRAAALCADVPAAADPGEHPVTVLFLGGKAGRSVLEGTSWKPHWARVWGPSLPVG